MDKMKCEYCIEKKECNKPIKNLVGGKYNDDTPIICCDFETNCHICNDELDEKGVGGLWDLAAEICDALEIDSDELLTDCASNQDIVFGELRHWIERQNYCCHCGEER